MKADGLLHVSVGGIPFQCADGDRMVNAVPSALIFAGSRADSSENSRKRNGLLDGFYGLTICHHVGQLPQ